MANCLELRGKCDKISVDLPHIAAASESAANTIQKPKPYTIQECMI